MQNQKYHISQIAIHWIMAIIIISLLAVGFYMTNLLEREATNRAFIYGLHKSFGVLILFLIIVRIIVRIVKSAPPLPKSIGKITRRSAQTVHFILYALMFLMPLSGYLMSNYFNHAVYLFGLKLPLLVEQNVELGMFFANAHEFLGFTFVGILILHISGVIRHRFFGKPENDVLKRMI